MSSSPSPAPTTSGTIHQNVVPAEVGWQFVPQYYTFVNKYPNRLHCFYTKNSTFMHGLEGEDGRPCHGQQEIHQKILSLGFENCKVYIHSVDAQASAAGGIIIQVIGQMSNRGEAWRKFVQTFFLAEQPTGYFVLNDVFRFLKEESVEDEGVESEEQEEEVQPQPVEEPVEPEVPVVVAAAEPEEPVREPTPEPEPAPVEEVAQPNGVHSEPEEVEEPVVEAAEPEPEPEPVQEPEPTPAPVSAQPSPQPAPAQPVPVQTQQAPQPPAPSLPKTWANLAAADSKKWGAAVAQESRGTSVVASIVPPPSRSATQTPISATNSNRGSHHGPKGGKNDHSGSSSSLQVFVKVQVLNGDLSEKEILAELQKHGKVVNHEFTNRNAVITYEEQESARKAISASQASNGFTLTNGDRKMRIFIEQRRERGDRPPQRGRGGPPQGDRGAPRGRGRARAIPSGRAA